MESIVYWIGGIKDWSDTCKCSFVPSFVSGAVRHSDWKFLKMFFKLILTKVTVGSVGMVFGLYCHCPHCFQYFILYWETYFKYENPVLGKKFKFPTAWID